MCRHEPARALKDVLSAGKGILALTTGPMLLWGALGLSYYSFTKIID